MSREPIKNRKRDKKGKGKNKVKKIKKRKRGTFFTKFSLGEIRLTTSPFIRSHRALSKKVLDRVGKHISLASIVSLDLNV